MTLLNKTAWSRRWRRLKSALTPKRKRVKRLKVNTDDIRPELEDVVTALIAQTTGDMDRVFSKWIRQYGANNPTGESEARAILEGLLKLAIANREQLNGRIVSSAEVGRMYDRYYDRLAEIDDLNAKAEGRELARNRASQELEFFEDRYNDVRDRTYNVSTEDKKKKWFGKQRPAERGDEE